MFTGHIPGAGKNRIIGSFRFIGIRGSLPSHFIGAPNVSVAQTTFFLSYSLRLFQTLFILFLYGVRTLSGEYVFIESCHVVVRMVLVFVQICDWSGMDLASGHAFRNKAVQVQMLQLAHPLRVSARFPHKRINRNTYMSSRFLLSRRFATRQRETETETILEGRKIEARKKKPLIKHAKKPLSIVLAPPG